MPNKTPRNPTTSAKPLPSRVYPRGNQGTFIYAPDIAVYVSTDQYGIIDISPFVTQFTLQRVVNQPSSFMCQFDNKFSRFDRVIRRMDRIVVFMKRVQWVQVFAGYVDVAPWETVVPGDAQLMATCTLKRLIYTFWDPHSAEAVKLFPRGNISSSVDIDSGSAATMFRLLTTIAKWPQDQIHVQKIPEAWLAQAVEVLKKTQEEQINDPDNGQILKSLKRLLAEQGDDWLSYSVGNEGQTIGDLLDAANTNAGILLGGNLMDQSGVEADWRKMVGKKNVANYPNIGSPVERASGFVTEMGGDLVSSGVQFSASAGANAHTMVMLRPDAAASLKDLSGQEHLNGTVVAGYISYADQKQAINKALTATKNHNGGQTDIQEACSHVSCPAGQSEHGWGTTIDFAQGSSPSGQTMEHYGWINVPDGDGGGSNPNHWTFVGNFQQGYPAYITAADKPQHKPGGYPGAGGGSYTNTKGQFDWQSWDSKSANSNQANNVFKSTYFWPGIDTMSQALTGKRAWINDVPLMESVSDMAAASLRDFQSGPNGDFIAYFPDRLGVYGKFPAMQVRDIEITDFKLIISDRNLVTHYVSVADMTNPEPHTGIDLDVFINAGYVTVEQPEVLRLLLGLPQDQDPVGLGNWIMQKFGIRPKRDDNMDIWNPGFNYMIALHRFQEAWSAQWNALAGFTFMPEIYPGMRIELVNYNIGVYVEQVVHSGSRTSGFTTTATVSTPMTKKNGLWKLLPMEFDPAQFKADKAFTPENDATTQSADALYVQARQQRIADQGF